MKAALRILTRLSSYNSVINLVGQTAHIAPEEPACRAAFSCRLVLAISSNETLWHGGTFCFMSCFYERSNFLVNF